MYIRLTRFDNTPIWLNAAFIVTIEPRRQGGSTVVPIGDGLDYDVRETPEAVLAMLEGAPVPAVVPVPAPEALVAQPEDMSAEPSVMTAADAVDVSGAAAEAPKEETPKAEAAKPKKKAAKKSAAPRKPRTRKAAEPALADAELERLRKMAPGSLKKLVNTLATQFKVEDAEAMAKALAEKGVFRLDRDHVSWS